MEKTENSIERMLDKVGQGVCVRSVGRKNGRLLLLKISAYLKPSYSLKKRMLDMVLEGRIWSMFGLKRRRLSRKREKELQMATRKM